MVSVVEAVERDLVELDRRRPGLSESSLAATARALAAGLDDGRASLAMKSMASKEFRETMAALAALAPDVVAEDAIDELERRREKRRAG